MFNAHNIDTTTAAAERHVAQWRTETGVTRQERRWCSGDGAAHAAAVRGFHKAARRYSKAFCALALADYEAEVEEAAAVARKAAAVAREDAIEAATGSMKLWQVTRTDDGGYDTYSRFVVAAATAEQARRVYPSDYARWDKAARRFAFSDGSPSEADGYGAWTDAIDTLEVVELGSAVEGMEHGTVLCASFHAG